MTGDRIILFDTETTGTDEGAQIIESAIAFIGPSRPPLDALDGIHGDLQVTVQRFKPSVPIKLGAMATHHIIEEDLVDCRPSSEFAVPSNVALMIGHNIDFDWKMAGRPKVKRVCTLALARKVWPSLDAHTLSAVIYSLFPHQQAQSMLRGAHNALVDVDNLVHVLRALCAALQSATWNELWHQSEDARVPEIITFGKHKAEPGQPPTLIIDLPRDYREWILKQKDMDPYLKVAVRRSFGQAAPMPRDEEV